MATELKSKIQAELAEMTEIQPSTRRDETIVSQSYMSRLAQGVAGLDDADWAKLSTAAQTWYNQAADAVDAKKDIPEFADLPKDDPAPSSGGRRRSSASSEDAPAKRDPKVGDQVKVTTKRGKVYEGKLVEIDEKDNLIVLETADNPKGEELNRDRCESIEIVGGEASGGKSSKAYTVDDAKEGDTVEIVNKRGKSFVGKITETTDKDIVLALDGSGEIEEILKDRVDSIKLIGSGHVDSTTTGSTRGGDDADKPSGRGRRSSASDESKGSKDADKGEKGVPVTLRLRELICENPDAKKDEISKLAKKEGLEFKDGTLDIAFNDTNKIIGILRKLGWKAGR